MPKVTHNEPTSKHIPFFTRMDGFRFQRTLKNYLILLLECVSNMNIIYLKLPKTKKRTHTF